MPIRSQWRPISGSTRTRSRLRARARCRKATHCLLVSPGLLPLRRSSSELLRLRPIEFAGLPGAESVADAITQSLSITTFRYVPPGLRSQLGSEKGRELSQPVESAPADGGGEQRRSVSVQRAHRWHICVEGLHRELPYIVGRYRSPAPAVVPARRRGRYHPQARAREARGRLEANGPRQWPSDDAVREGAGFPDRCTMVGLS